MGGDPHWGNKCSKQDKRPAPFSPQSLVVPARGVPGLCGEAAPGCPRTAPAANGGSPHTPGPRSPRGSGAGTGTSPTCAPSRAPGAPRLAPPLPRRPDGTHLLVHRLHSSCFCCCRPCSSRPSQRSRRAGRDRIRSSTAPATAPPRTETCPPRRRPGLACHCPCPRVCEAGEAGEEQG